LKGKVMGARVTKTAAWWFVWMQVEMPDEQPDPHRCAVGVDVGLNRRATLSASEGFETQAFLKATLKKLRTAGHSSPSSSERVKEP
jgi:putative transposase